MAKLQKEKKTLRNRFSFQSSSQSLIIANASFKSNPSHDSKKQNKNKNKNWPINLKTVSMAGQTEESFKRQLRVLFFSLFFV